MRSLIRQVLLSRSARVLSFPAGADGGACRLRVVRGRPAGRLAGACAGPLQLSLGLLGAGLKPGPGFL